MLYKTRNALKSKLIDSLVLRTEQQFSLLLNVTPITKFPLSFNTRLHGFDILLGLFLRHGKLALLLHSFGKMSFNLITQPANARLISTNQLTIYDSILWLWRDASVSYQVKYCQLNRKVRKIVKNKYRYQKRYEWIPPHLRIHVAARFFKKLVLTEPSFLFYSRLENSLNDYFLNLETSNLKNIVQQTQSIAVSVLAQTKRKV